jgi:hypothetical protein
MSAPTRIEHEHCQKLVGRQIFAINWDELEWQALPILVFSVSDQNGYVATATVFADHERNGSGHLDH